MSATALPDDPQRNELRQHMRTQRMTLTPQQRMSSAQTLRQTLESLQAFRKATHIAGYWASHGEIPLNLAVAPLAAREQQFYLPQTGRNRRMRFAAWRVGESVAANRFGIPEPLSSVDCRDAEQLDLVLVPLLAFDDEGSRLGYGGGYYDFNFAFLKASQRPARPLLVGVGYHFQQVDHLQARAWDVALDYVATDAALIDCHSGKNIE